MGYIVKAACAMVRVGETYVTVAKGAPVPAGADPDHVQVLVDRGLVVEGEPQGYEADPDIPPPFNAAHASTGDTGSAFAGGTPAAVPPYPLDGSEADQDAWVAAVKVEDALAYATEHPDDLTSILAAEQRKGDKSRTTLVDGLAKQQGS